MNQIAAVKEKPVDVFKKVLSNDSVQQQFQNAMKDGKDLFIASLIDLFVSDTGLQKCNPNLVIMEALKAATLKLPINKSLGFAYVIPYEKSIKNPDGSWRKEAVPNFQIGYKGLLQLAMRSGQYKVLNADVVLEGEMRGYSKLTGQLDIDGTATSDKIVGYFAHLETLNGFKKTVYASAEDVKKHGEKYSPAFSNKKSPWQTDFDAMAIKTMLKRLLSRYGLMSVDMVDAISKDDAFDAEYSEIANQTPLPFEPDGLIEGEVLDPETGAIETEGQEEQGEKVPEPTFGV